MVLQGKVSEFDQRQRWGRIVPFGLKKGDKKDIMFFFPDQRTLVRDEHGRESIDPNRFRTIHVQKGDHIFFEPGPSLAGMPTAGIWALDRKPKDQEKEEKTPEPVLRPRPVVQATTINAKNPDQKISAAMLMDTRYTKGGVIGKSPGNGAETRKKKGKGDRVRDEKRQKLLSGLQAELGNRHMQKPIVQEENLEAPIHVSKAVPEAQVAVPTA